MACGLAGVLTIEVEGPGLPVGERRVFPQPFVLIGRDDRADLLLDHDLVSRRHVFLQIIEGRPFFVDLDSRTGTLVGGTSADSGWLESGHALTVGPYQIKVVPSDFEMPGTSGEPPANPLLARSSSSTPGLPRISLEFQSRTAGHSVWRMSQILALVGSSPRCKVRLLDSNVSKLHCALIRTMQGLWVVDLLGREGITVNGVPVRYARLRPADVLGLGHVQVRPNFEDVTPQPGPMGGPNAFGSFNFGAGLPERAVARPWTPGPGGSMPPPMGGMGGVPGCPSYGYTPQPPQPPQYAPPVFPTDQPPAPAQPPAPTGAPASEPALSLLLGHFGQMQQQMLDQFQQSMFMMLQMFSGMHREQMGVMREELERLRELNEEIASIKAEMATRQVSTRVPFPMPGQSPRPVNGHHPHSAPGPAGAPGQPPRGRPQDTTNGPGPSPGDRGAEEAAKNPALEPSADVHDWLNDRLTAITVEQQNRWQRIMGILRGDK